MSIRTNALTDHKIADYRNDAAVIARLSQSISETNNVRSYWQSVDPQSVEERHAWSVCRIFHPSEGEYLRYDGPGGFCIQFGGRVAIVGALSRWSGFATIPALQSAHVAAFRAVARAIGGTQIVLVPEFDPVEEIAPYDNSSLENCIALLKSRWGAPHPKTETINEDDEVYYRRKVPTWYVEALDLSLDSSSPEIF